MNINPIPFQLKVVLGGAELSKEQFSSLDSGDIILLDQPTNVPLNISVEGGGQLLGFPGTSHGQKAIQIEKL